MKLGKMVKVELRDVWKHEANDFSKWLSLPENMQMLSDTIGIDLEPIEREAKIGKYWLDILAKESSTGRTVIVENQLEDSNHDHLGKIITYAAGKNADIVVWIVKHANEEHKKAIEWLNNRTDSSLGFFLLEIEMWKIGDSAPAPKFNVVESPNEWAKVTKDSMSETLKLAQKFWIGFNAYAEKCPEFMRIFNLRKPRAQNWYDFSINKTDCTLSIGESTYNKEIRATIYVHTGGEDNATARRIADAVPRMEKELNCRFDLGTAKDKTFNVRKKIDFEKDEEKWEECFAWYCDMLVKLREQVHKILQ